MTKSELRKSLGTAWEDEDELVRRCAELRERAEKAEARLAEYVGRAMLIIKYNDELRPMLCEILIRDLAGMGK